nr:unnamed protein product [Callosobruchus chinensis]
MEPLWSKFAEAKVHYKTLKNQYVKLLQKSKSELIKNKIDSADNKSQAMWQIINKLTGKNNPGKIFPEDQQTECQVHAQPGTDSYCNMQHQLAFAVHHWMDS